MNKEFELADQLRVQLLGGLHLGILKSGSKLPSIREISERDGVDHRLVARAYTQLENEKLVEIRGRSGVYVATAPVAEARLVDARLRWLATLIHEAWSRRITFSEIHNLARRAALHRLRCVCVESTNDHLVAFSSELAADFGFTIVPIRFKPQREGELCASDKSKIENEVRSADLVATTVFHANSVREVAERVGKPFVAVSINPAMREEVGQLLTQGPLRVVVSDPDFEARARVFLSKALEEGRLQVMLSSHYQRARPADEIATLFTKAARRELGLPEYHLVPVHAPFISPESAAEICELIVHLSSTDAQLQMLDQAGTPITYR